MRHVAIFVGDAIEKILRGIKTVEGRFSEARIAPFGAVHRGDELLLKPAGGPIVGRAFVDNVLYFENLTGELIGKLRREYQEEMAAGDDFWRAKGKCRYATLIFLAKPERFVAPLQFRKRDRRPWVVLG